MAKHPAHAAPATEEHRRNWKELALDYVWEGTILLALVFAGFIATWVNLDPLAMKKLTLAEILQSLGPLFFIIVFVERSIEVIVSTCREPELASLKQQQLNAKTGLDWLKVDAGKTSQARDTEAKALLEEHDAASHALVKFQTQTRQWALILSLGIGLTLGLLGYRVMEPLLAARPGSGRRILDVVLTGSFIAGGSHGVHVLITEILNLISLGKKRP
jgi:hypothetical protein